MMKCQKSAASERGRNVLLAEAGKIFCVPMTNDDFITTIDLAFIR